MTCMQGRGISSERVHGSSGADLECCICRDLLWKPVACQTCETPFCSSCITQWLNNNPNKCPNRCEAYTERKCPPFIAKLLAQLQIACFYRSNGCEQIIPYDALDKHEIECNYQLQQCSGCQLKILKKDFDEHEKSCTLIEWTCPDCQLVFKRDDISGKHTDIICLREQLRVLRDESKQNKQELQKLSHHWNKLCVFNPEFTKVTIKFDDLPSAIADCKIILGTYRALKWSGMCYGHESFLKRNYPQSGYVTCFTATDSLQIAYFKVEASIEIDRPNETFTFDSISACTAWNDNVQLTVVGLRNSRQVNVHTTILSFGQPQVILLHWKDVDKVIFRPFGGTAHPGSSPVPLPHVILTQLTIDPLN